MIYICVIIHLVFSLRPLLENATVNAVAGFPVCHTLSKSNNLAGPVACQNVAFSVCSRRVWSWVLLFGDNDVLKDVLANEVAESPAIPHPAMFGLETIYITLDNWLSLTYSSGL
jgi:hypothetical protein